MILEESINIIIRIIIYVLTKKRDLKRTAPELKIPVRTFRFSLILQ